MDKHTDQQLVQRCAAGEHSAFEHLVRRYQVLVCSIAYSIVGNVSWSEDIGQEAFLQAWRKLGELRDPSQFKTWVSTIARNEARAWLRRRSNTTQALHDPTQIPETSREEPAVDDEQADLLWKTLSQLPESYREPLVLYYRNEQSVSEVAGALSLSQSATKQRLARGREMLRTEVLATIEQGLRKTAPTGAFTIGVMALVSSTPKVAAAAGVSSAKVVAAATKTTIGGAASGTLIGLLGGFAGAFASWYTAEYQSQRKLIVRQGLVYLIGMSVFMLPFVAMGLGWNPTQSLGRNGYMNAYAVWMLTFLGLNSIWVFWGIRSFNRLQKQERDANAERLPRAQAALAQGVKVKGRRWVSSRSLLGLPLVHVAFPDRAIDTTDAEIADTGTARGWIAVGHFAYGRVVAIGHRAIAPIAIGNQAAGLISAGVFSVGLISFGVFSVAPLALGVISIGGICFGGAIAAGALAVAPLAFGAKAAKGAMVFALQFAEGPLAYAPQANNEAAAEYMQSSVVMQQLDSWMYALAQSSGNSNLSIWVVGLVVVLALAQRIVLARPGK